MPQPLLRTGLAIAASLLLTALAPCQEPDAVHLQQQVVDAHAAWCHATYSACVQQAEALATAVDALIARPDATTLAAAREAWLQARRSYGRSEVLRFHDGPIEPLEPFLNAWPVDEAWIDAVAGRPDAGIVHDTVHHPVVSAAVLRLANERGGEANISLGWHAIEFLLWGQDLDPKGPGARPATDYVVGIGRNADRRAAYLREVTRTLVADLRTLRAAWAPDAPNYRRTFTADATGAVRRMLAGAVVLTAFELAGERLAVALETRDQEQEHSCFSDSTCADLVANQQGIVEVLRGANGPGGRPGVLDLVRSRDAKLATMLDDALTATSRALAAIPAPFDQAFLGDDDAPGRRAIRGAIEALEHQAEVLLLVGKQFGHELPLKPGD